MFKSLLHMHSSMCVYVALLHQTFMVTAWTPPIFSTQVPYAPAHM